MKALLTFALLAGTLHAQVAGGRAAGGVVFANPGGYGNVAYPGTGRPSVSVAGQQTGLHNGLGTRRNSASAYGYPVFVGGGYYDQGGYGTQQQQQQQPNITIINNPPPPAAAPVVVINQNFAPPPQIGDEGSTEATHIFQPQRREVEAASDQSGSAAPHYFLIAYKDHSVYSALAYWVEDKTMHYVTPQQTHNQASLDLIDMDFTKKLNQR